MPVKTPLRPKHVPSRSCVSCHTTTAKRTLVRVVRTPEGHILPDPTGKQAGRGAYLCADSQCWDQALKKGRLEPSLKAKLPPEEIDGLRSFAHDNIGEVR